MHKDGGRAERGKRKETSKGFARGMRLLQEIIMATSSSWASSSSSAFLIHQPVIYLSIHFPILSTFLRGNWIEWKRSVLLFPRRWQCAPLDGACLLDLTIRHFILHCRGSRGGIRCQPTIIDKSSIPAGSRATLYLDKTAAADSTHPQILLVHYVD